MLFLTVKFGWDVEMGRLNLDVKFMVLIISVSVLFVKIVACFFPPFLPCFRGSYCLWSTLAQWRNFTQTQYNYVFEFHSAKCLMFYPALLGSRLIQKRIVMLWLFCTVSQWIPNLFFVACVFSSCFLWQWLCMHLRVVCRTLLHVPIKYLSAWLQEQKWWYHHGLKAVTNKTLS